MAVLPLKSMYWYLFLRIKNCISLHEIKKGGVCPAIYSCQGSLDFTVSFSCVEIPVNLSWKVNAQILALWEVVMLKKKMWKTDKKGNSPLPWETDSLYTLIHSKLCYWRLKVHITGSCWSPSKHSWSVLRTSPTSRSRGFFIII